VRAARSGVPLRLREHDLDPAQFLAPTGASAPGDGRRRTPCRRAGAPGGAEKRW
jgi:hypothetical protein